MPKQNSVIDSRDTGAEPIAAKPKGLDLITVMGMNRHERRALAKRNKIKRIAGSNRPYVKEKKDQDKG